MIDVTSLKFFMTENNNSQAYFRCYNLITSIKTCENMWQEIIISKTKIIELVI